MVAIYQDLPLRMGTTSMSASVTLICSHITKAVEVLLQGFAESAVAINQPYSSHVTSWSAHINIVLLCD